jgi:hypothetical protein
MSSPSFAYYGEGPLSKDAESNQVVKRVRNNEPTLQCNKRRYKTELIVLPIEPC